MLALLGVLTIVVMLVAIMTKRLSPKWFSRDT